MEKSRETTGAVTLAVVAAIAVYALTDNAVIDNVCYLGVLVGASIGAWMGAERTPRELRLVPRLIAVGISLSALGDVLWSGLDLMGLSTDVSIADPAWFASYVFLIAALWVALGRGRGVARLEVGFVIDAATIVVVSVLVFWSLSIGAIVVDQSATPFQRTVWSTYPIADAILFALVARILMSRRARTGIDASFAGGVCLWLAADIAYLQVPEVGYPGLLMDSAWMIAPVLLARAAWRVHEVESRPAGPAGLAGWAPQLGIAVGPLAVPPALELISDLRGEPDQPLLLLTGTALLIMFAFVRTARMIRSEQRALRELEVARDAALEASEAKSLFLANVSHEIRTPLTTVLATAELLEDTRLDDVQLKLLSRMHRSGELLKSLVEGLLDFSRIEAGQLELTSRPFDLHAMVADVADLYGPRARQAGIQFEWRLDQYVPQIIIGDPGRLFQVLTNLLDNALKFTHEGQVTLTVRAATATNVDDVGRDVEFRVSDTGIGIRVEDLESVFESFSQVDGSMTRNYGGSGLGLAICKQLTALMGGSLVVQSQFSAGSTFVVRLPLVHPAPARATSHEVPVLIR